MEQFPTPNPLPEIPRRSSRRPLPPTIRVESPEAVYDLFRKLGQAESPEEKEKLAAMFTSKLNALSPGDEQASPFRQFAINSAKEQQVVIEEKCKKNDVEAPHYELLELIGKGAYGRVYKSISSQTKRIVAVKIIDTESMDYAASGPAQGIKDTLKEIEILRRLQKSNTVNVNTLIDAFEVLSSLWIVSDYCPGGSLTTLRRGHNQLSEEYIRPIARELGLALKSVHDAGIVHRDVKCSNVMVDENGNMQLIDFGVAGLVQTNMEVDKRTTIVGTPHWMPPEMQKNIAEVAHSFEVDVWAYGITLYECAMGAPPNAQKIGRQLQQAIRNSPPRLSPDRFSEELCDLVASACEIDPKKRPTMAQLCEHKYVAGTKETHPTSTLKQLVERFYKWQFEGGLRHSILPNKNSAPPIEFEDVAEGVDWNFSMTEKFEKRMSTIPDELNQSFTFPRSANENEPFEEETAKQWTAGDAQGSVKTATEAEEEARAARGRQAMQGIFNDDKPSYRYAWGKSDLPFRTGDSSDSLHHKELSVNSNNGKPTISLNDPPKQAKRDTQAWTFADNQPPPLQEAPLYEARSDSPSSSFTFPTPADFSPVRPQLHHAATMPVGGTEIHQIEDTRRGTLDLDALMGPDTSLTTSTAGDLTSSFDFLSASNYSAPPQGTFADDAPDSFEMYAGSQTDLDGGFAAFDQEAPNDNNFTANEIPGYGSAFWGSSHASSRLPSPEPALANGEGDFTASPPPASPVLPAETGPFPSDEELAAEFPANEDGSWFPQPPGPEMMDPNASDAALLAGTQLAIRQWVHGANRLLQSFDEYEMDEEELAELREGEEDGEDDEEDDEDEEGEGHEGWNHGAEEDEGEDAGDEAENGGGASSYEDAAESFLGESTDGSEGQTGEESD